MERIPHSPRMLAVFVLAIATYVAACGSASGPSASTGASVAPVGGPVTTPEDAVARVVAAEPRFAGITERDPDMIGQASWYQVAPASGVGAFLVTIRVGWGDCPSGCIEEHTWVYAVAPDGGVTLQSEGGGAVPIDAWPAPGAGDAGGGQAGTGLHFTAVAGPTCPVEQPGDPACAAKPVPNVPLVIMDGNGNIMDKLLLNAGGTGVITLEPGEYIIRAEGVEGFMSGPEAQSVTVVDGRINEVLLTFDTGIR